MVLSELTIASSHFSLWRLLKSSFGFVLKERDTYAQIIQNLKYKFKNTPQIHLKVKMSFNHQFLYPFQQITSWDLMSSLSLLKGK